MTAAELHARKQLYGVRETDYSRAALELLKESGCTVHRWRSALTGVAFCESPEWLIEAPEPTTALRFAVFAHEVGHQMLHRGSRMPRWLEEVQAWEYSLDQFKRFELPEIEVAYTRARRSLTRSFTKAIRAGVPPTMFYANVEAHWWAESIDARQLAEDIRNGGA